MTDLVKFIETVDRTIDFEERSRIIFAAEDKIQGWCPLPLMWLLNTALNCLEKDEEYLEVGTFCGRSLAGAMKDNTARAHVIDPLNLWTQNGTIEDIWHRTIDTYKLNNRVTLYQQFVETFCGKLPNIGVFFYDGNHDSGHTYEALCKFEPRLSKSAIIIVDDYEIFGGDQQKVFHSHTLDINHPVKTDTDRWISERPDKIKCTIETPWLNGQMVICYEA